tara:strand:- start:2794 stop:3744 length:951 start_codon:yes stop_codon:yes gene_type:complete
MIKMKKLLGTLCLTAAIASSFVANAADWKPNGTLRLQIGFGAGGSTDTMGRILAKVMKEQTGWNIIAENKTGGGGIAMFTGIATMPAKGNVIGLGVNMPVLVNLTLNSDKIPFDLNSFDYLGTVAKAQLALIAHKDAPFNNLAEMVSYAKNNDGLAIGTGAKPQQLLMDFINRQDGAGFRYVSTKGEAETHKLILGGQVLAGFSAGTHIKYLESGDFKMIASSNVTRHDYAPNAQTFIEQGYSAYVEPVFYLATTANTPDDAKAALAKAIDNAMSSPEVQKVVRNAARSPAMNLGPEKTKKMMFDGLENVKVLFGK